MSASVPAKGRGREGSSWGTLRLPWRLQAEGESTSVIPECSTKSFSTMLEEETALPSKEVSPISEETCYREQLLTHHCHLHPHLPPQKLLHACETEGGMQSPSPCPKHMHLFWHPFYAVTTSRDRQKKLTVSIHRSWFCFCSERRCIVKTAFTLRIVHLPNFIT